jgi:rhodanese-related sulfurtransferase
MHASCSTLTPAAARCCTHQVVDVRDTDYEGGHIKGSLNQTVDKFEDPETVDKLLDNLKEQGKSTIVFHCQLSRIRGPLAASRTLERLAVAVAEAAADADTAKPEILVLDGGFERFEEAAAKDPELQELIEKSDVTVEAV